MAINRTSISSQDIRDNHDVAIRLVFDRPDTSAYLETPLVPNTLVGYFDTFTDTVYLYMVDPTGRRYVSIN